MSKYRSKGVSALALTTSTGVVAFLSFLVQAIVAARFGIGRVSDAYFAALTIPNTVTNIFLASLPSLLLSVFVEQKIKVGEKSAWLVVSAILNVMMLLFGLLVVVGVIFARQIASTLLPGFDPATIELSGNLLRILFPMVFLSMVGALLGGILQAYGDFLEFGLARIVRWLIVVLIAYWAESIYGVAIGMVAGLIIYVLLYLFSLRDAIGLYRPILTCAEPLYRVLLRSWGILLIVSMISRGRPILERYFASSLGSGSISYLSFAANLVFLLDTLLANSLASVLFPELSSSIALQDWSKSGQTISLAVCMSGFIAVPLVFQLLVFRKEIVCLLLERGAFGVEDTAILSSTLLFSVGSMLAPIFASITSKALYSLRAVRFLFVLSVLNMIMYIFLALVLVPILNFKGLVATTSIVATISWMLQIIYLRWRLKDIPMGRMFQSLAMVSGISAVCVLVSRFLYHVMRASFEGVPGTLPNLGMLCVAVGSGAGVYLLIAARFHLEEMKLIQKRLIRRPSC